MPAFKYGVIRSIRTDEHFGAFWDAAISSVDEVAEHFAVADQIERQSDAIHIYLPDTDAYARTPSSCTASTQLHPPVGCSPMNGRRANACRPWTSLWRGIGGST